MGPDGGCCYAVLAVPRLYYSHIKKEATAVIACLVTDAPCPTERASRRSKETLIVGRKSGFN